MSHIAVITVDGPAGAGKGTVARAVAAELGFHYLDSGKLYRFVALRARDCGIAADDCAGLMRLLDGLTAVPQTLSALPQQQQEALTLPETGQLASVLAAHPDVRQRLLPIFRTWRQPPGLVADGRDMATVVFPDADLRVFLTATLQVRAQRRRAQLAEKGIYAKISDVCADIGERDRQDEHRAVAPLKPHADALIIDSTNHSISDVAASILRAFRPIASCHSTAEH